MNSGDLNKVWEIKTLKRKPREDDARKILEKVAKQVQPIMRKHNWRVKVLSEMCPKNQALLGLNVGHGVHVKLRLRRANSDFDFLPFHEVLDTMLHELCHNAHGPHNASFYKLWDELRKECEDLINKGISGEGCGFDLPGRRLGGASCKPLSSLRQSALAAAQKRARLGVLMPPGPKNIGGDSTIMKVLSPMQAAAMAAERRLRDNTWCGSEFSEELEEEDYSDKVCCPELSSAEFDECVKLKSRKRTRDSSNDDNFVDLTEGVDELVSISSSNNHKKVLSEEAMTSSISGHNRASDECGTWQCSICTLFNPPLSLVCEVCTAQRPRDDNLKNMIWSCRLCTLENDVKMDKCSACGNWRYSHGPPVATGAPNRVVAPSCDHRARPAHRSGNFSPQTMSPSPLIRDHPT